MILKLRCLILIFCLLSFKTIAAQQESKPCLCELLTESEENDTKVFELARKVQNAFDEYSADGLNNNFDHNAFLEFIFKGIDLDLTDAYTRGFRHGIGDTSQKLGDKILSEMENGSYYNFINYHYNIIEKAYYFRFRIYSEETGINYHDYKVCTDGDNLKINDVYIFLTGEHLSDTMRRLFKVSKVSDGSVIDPSDNIIFEMLKAKRLAEIGKSKEAYETIEAIEGDIEKEKFFLLVKALIASTYDDNIYMEVLDKFAKLYPDDPTLYLKLIDYYILRGNYAMVHVYVDKLIDETDDDFLNIYKAHMYMLQEDYKNAEKHYSYIRSYYPGIFTAHVGEMVCLTYQEKFKETLAIAQYLVDEGYDKEELTAFFEEKEPDGSNQLEAFVESKLYKKWKG